MNMKKFKSQKGAISIFAMLAMLFFMIVIIGAYTITSKRAQTQKQSTDYLQSFNSEDVGKIYDNKIANSTERIPIYTKEQLWSIGTDSAIEIDGKIYAFSDTSKYKLMNDIIIDIDDQSDSNVFTYEVNNLDYNNYDIFYYHTGYKDYYQKAQDTDNEDILVAGQKLKYKDLGYVEDD